MIVEQVTERASIGAPQTPTKESLAAPNPNARTIADDIAVDECIDRVVALLGAAETALQQSGAPSRRQAKRLRQVATNASVANLTMSLSDEVLRIRNETIASKRFRDVVNRSDGSGFGRLDRLMLNVGATLAPIVPRMVMPLVRARLRAETSQTILDARPAALRKHQAKREALGRKLNFNRLGEAIVGTEEAQRRLGALLELIQRPTTTNVSVKASAIVANLSVLSYDETVQRIAAAFREVFSVAAKHHVFVNVDMEEYRDLHLTADAFMLVLQETDLRNLYAGIVLQAYIPDSHAVAGALGVWANARVRDGGSPIRIRLVKGANLAMEQVDAELHGWNPATYPTKADVDASWKLLLDTLLHDRFSSALHVGVASHNLFDVAWALHLRDQLPPHQRHRVSFEMLEGMAESQAVAVAQLTGGLLMYTPVVEPEDFVAAIGYLTRRLDENTAPENFLRALFDLTPGSATFIREANRFRAAVHHRHDVATESFRAKPLQQIEGGFLNEPDADFTQAPLRLAALSVIAAGPTSSPGQLVLLTDRQAGSGAPAAIAAGPTSSPGQLVLLTDRQAGSGAPAAIATTDIAPAPTLITSTTEVDRVVGVARAALSTWSALTAEQRANVLRSVGSQISTHRTEVLATIVADAAKTISEADPEVSEAVDFARFYAYRAEELDECNGLDKRQEPDGLVHQQSEPLGVVVVAPPWNFAYAIAMGGVLAALGAGNTVILKPAPQAPHTAQRVAQDCWAAGVPVEALQLLSVPDDEVGRHLITHPGVDAVILTGALATARMFLDWKPSLRLLAETSGKNSLIITATADLDVAIKDLVKSAFGHGGQKCSAASLAIVEASVFDDPSFARRLGDAVRTLRCGAANDPSTDIAPLIERPSSSLQRALTILDPGESWLVKPELIKPELIKPELIKPESLKSELLNGPDGEGTAWSPGVRIGVAEGSWFHRTECFGPVLGIMRARDLDHAIAIQNATEFGLTAGIHSLDPATIEVWKDRVEAGNLYVNRSITGAIVNRQPFGGWKASTIGATAKAGGPHYLETLRRWFDNYPNEPGQDQTSFASTLQSLFASESDPSALRSESNVLRYRPLPRGVLLRIGLGAPKDSLELAQSAAWATQCPLTVSDERKESEHVCIQRLQTLRPDRLRVVGECTNELRRAANELGIRIDEAVLVANASIEVTRWAREQAVSTTMHRHGRLLAPTQERAGSEDQVA
jgi:RHH-type transcriptional regulator, proline utilization regulon repressor / proline dehydrogenase / delta 1-pyrroline-5-carboxylate dehydrogenase